MGLGEQLREQRDLDVDAEGSSEPGRPGVLDVLIVLGAYRRWLVFGPTFAAAVAVIVVLALPKSYTATTRILTPQQGQSTAAALLSQFSGGGLAGLAGGAMGIKNPSDLYIGMLRSDTVADTLIERFDLKKYYDERYSVDARKALHKDSTFAADKSGIITIEVELHDAQLAADVANAYVEELHTLTSTLAITEASQRRVFYERQLQATKEKLGDAEMKLREALGKGGLVSVDAQSRSSVETVARLRATISAKEVQIGAMRAYATPENPEMRRAEQEAASLKRELARLESGLPDGEREGVAPASGRGIGNIKLLREVKYQEAMFEILAKQFEIARADESKGAPLVQVVDRAVRPEKKSKPRRGLIVALAALAGLVLATAAAIGRNALENAERDPEMGGKISALREAWRLRSKRA